MKVTEIDPSTVIQRFPEHLETIKHLFKKSPNFQTLCSDYRRCANALEFWKKSDRNEAQIRREEYETLLHELESEILGNVKNMNLPGAE